MLDAGVLNSSLLSMNSRLTHSTAAGSEGSSGMLFTAPLSALPRTVSTAYTALACNCLLYRNKPHPEAQTSQKGWAWLLRNQCFHGG